MPSGECSDGCSATWSTSFSGPGPLFFALLADTALRTDLRLSLAASLAWAKMCDSCMPIGAADREEVKVCCKYCESGLRAAPVPSTVVTTSPPSAQTGRRHELIARCSGFFFSAFHHERITVQPPQPPWPHGFLGPASATSGERR